MARTRTILRHVLSCLAERVAALAYEQEVATVFGGDSPKTHVPGDGTALVRWAYRWPVESKDQALMQYIGARGDYFFRACTILSTLNEWMPRVNARVIHDRLDTWLRDNRNNLGGEPYEDSHRAEMRTEVYNPLPKPKGKVFTARRLPYGVQKDVQKSIPRR